MADKRDHRAQPPLFIRGISSVNQTQYPATHSSTSGRPRVCQRCGNLRQIAVTVNREPRCLDCIRELAGDNHACR